MNRSARLAMLLAFLFFAFSLSGCFSVDAAGADSTKRIGKAQATGEIQGGALFVQIRPGAGETWPANGSAEVWIARLDGAKLNGAEHLDDRRTDNLLVARVPFHQTAGEEGLYLLRYRVGDGDNAVTGSLSLAEALGSLQLRLVGPDSFQAGTLGAVRVLAADRFTGEPVGGADVHVAFKGKEGAVRAFDGKTGANGACELSFRVPSQELTEPVMQVAADWRGQKAEVEQKVQLRRDAKLLLTSDKPLYQPGQTMHLRALALSAAQNQPLANRDGLIEVQDAKGNKVFKKPVRSNEFGIVHADFALADEVNMGVFQIKATVDQSSADKTVEVKRYTLPKFKVGIDADRPWYLPGQTITGAVKADYIFGKPCANAEIVLEGLGTIVGVETFATIKGKTDANGRFSYEMKIPDTLVGREADQGKARVQLHATVVDPAGHKQEALRSFPVAKAPLVIQALPESGQLIAGVRNRLYTLVTSPDGSPAKAHVMAQPGAPPREDGWWKTDQAVAADRLGLAEFEIDVPDQTGYTLTIRARDDGGAEASATLRLRAEKQAAPLLLRADQPTYRIGDVIALNALVGKAPTNTVYFDLVRDNQTLLTKSADVENGHAVATIPATPDLVGAVVATAYVFAANGNLVRDTRVIYINPEADLKVEIRPGKEIYRPGENATVDFKVADAAGHAVASALGVTIVDEAVFALQDMQPGLEKIFFTIEKELMKPRYEFHTFDPAFVALQPDNDQVRKRGQMAMLAAIKPALQPAVDRKVANDLRPAVRDVIMKQVQGDLERIGRLYEQSKGAGESAPQGSWRDPWFTPYRIFASGLIVYQIDSAGPDRKFYTEDDVRAVSEKAQNKLNRNARRDGGGGFGRGALGAVREEIMFDAMEAPAAPMAGARLAQGKAVAEAGEMAGLERKKARDADKPDAAAGPAVRVREYFPETLYVNPTLITGADGRARIELPMADSITTWRIAAQAVSKNGWLGSGTAPVKVFQDFFIDIDFPPTLTRGDAVKVPIALYNYLQKPQTVTLQIQAADWFEMQEGNLTRQVALGPGEVKAEYLSIKATNVGRKELTVLAKGSKQSDAVKRNVLIEADGKMYENNIADRVPNEARQTVSFPGGTVPGADKLFVKIHPGLMSQVVEGLDNIFRMPGGCFEQTSSTTYPNVMVLDYLKAVQKITPELQMKAEGFINQGYQKLVTFEVPGGGFEWFGRAPAHVILTAYGLMEFYDMSKVYNVDPDVIKRTQNWLAGKQQGDGSWKPNEQFLDAVAAAFAKDVLRNTAYVTWALARSGFKGEALAKGLGYLEAHRGEAKDAYTLALLANALVDGGGKAASIDAVFGELAKLRKDEGDIAYWPTGEPTAIRSNGKSADIETTALAALALLHAKREPQTINRVVTYLTKSKDAFGTYHSTQATVWAMHVLLGVARGGGSDAEGQVVVMVNGQKAGEFKLTAADNDVLRQVDASNLLREGDNEVLLSFAGKGAPAYQVVTRYFVPWSQIDERPKKEPISIDVAYDKTRLAVDEQVGCTVTVNNHAPGDFGMVVVDLGVPPGFAPQRETLQQLVAAKQISKFSTTARQITLYIDKLEMNKPLKVSFKLVATLAMHAQAPASKVYNYYNPETQALAKPVVLTVR